MPYPYGTQNAPVVGNGLGGLPRRAVATTAAAPVVSRPVKFERTLNSYATFTRLGSTSGGQFGGVIMFPDKVLAVWRYDYGGGYENGVQLINEDGSANGSPTTYWLASSAQSAFRWYSASSGKPAVFHVVDNSTFISIYDSYAFRVTLNSNGSIAGATQFNVPSSGTYVNGDTWSATYAVGTTSRQSLVSGDHIYLVRRDNNSFLGVFKFKLDGTFVAAIHANSSDALSTYSGSLELFKSKFGFVCLFNLSDGSAVYLRSFSINEQFDTILAEPSSGSINAYNHNYACPLVGGQYFDYENSCAGWMVYYNDSNAPSYAMTMPFKDDGTKKHNGSYTNQTTTTITVGYYGASLTAIGNTSPYGPVQSDATSLRMLPVLYTKNSSPQLTFALLQGTPTFQNSQGTSSDSPCYGYMGVNPEGYIQLPTAGNYAKHGFQSPDLTMVAGVTEGVDGSYFVSVYWAKMKVTR